MSTQTTMSSSERVDALHQKVNIMIEWQGINELTDLMREIVGSARNPDLSKSERARIYKLGAQVEGQVTKLAGKETIEYVTSFANCNIDPACMLGERKYFVECAENAPTANLRRAFEECARKIQSALDEGSERLAKNYIDGAERSIADAKKAIAEGNQGDGGLYLFRIACHLEYAENFLDGLRRKNREGKMGHLWYVGLPRVAERRGMSAEDLHNSLWQQIRDAWQDFAPLWVAEEQRRTQEEQKRQETIRNFHIGFHIGPMRQGKTERDREKKNATKREERILADKAYREQMKGNNPSPNNFTKKKGK